LLPGFDRACGRGMHHPVRDEALLAHGAGDPARLPAAALGEGAAEIVAAGHCPARARMAQQQESARQGHLSRLPARGTGPCASRSFALVSFRWHEYTARESVMKRSSVMSEEAEPTYTPSEDEPFMNERQQAYFRAKLIAWKNEILREAR